jgi:glycosyltransferase involved in cell wall biosynthesis
MRFSILIPVVKTKFFNEALGSALAQTFDDYEIVVLDNKADAPLASVARQPKVRYVANEERLPPAENWNKGISLCKGDFIILLCDDDMLKPNTLSEVEIFLAENPEVEVVRILREEIGWGRVLRFSCPGAAIETIDTFVYFQETYLRGNALSDMAFSRVAANEIGGFRLLPAGWGCDRLLTLEIAKRKNKIGNLNKILLTYRFSEVNLTADIGNTLEKMRGDELYYHDAKQNMNATDGQFKQFALVANQKRFQSQQDARYIVAFVHLNIKLFRQLWKMTKHMETSRWRSIFVASMFAIQKWLGKK